jgi:hypothetical protein
VFGDCTEDSVGNHVKNNDESRLVSSLKMINSYIDASSNKSIPNTIISYPLIALNFNSICCDQSS